MKTWFVSRHPGALQWMQRNNISFDEHAAHLDPKDVNQGDKVIGSLPVNLAAQIQERGAEYWNLSLLMPASARGQELSADELEQFNAKLEQYRIEFVQSFNADILTASQLNSEQKPIEPKSANNSTPEIDTRGWAREIFNLHAWNDSNAQRALNHYLNLTFQLPKETGKALFGRLKNEARLGKKAFEYMGELEPLLKSQKVLEAEQFVETIKQEGRSKKITNYLDYQVQKTKDYIKNRNTRTSFSKKKYYKPKLPKIQLIKGLHPQALRNLKPSQQWSIYIDETGSVFGNNFENLASTDVGKIVALVLPQNSKLPPLKKPVHSTDLSTDKVEELITAIVNSSSGVFGASLDNVLEVHSWMAAMDQFIRLLLLMLPMHLKSHTRVDVFIEERGGYKESEQLLALTEAIESELKTTAPEIFSELHLNLQFMTKEHPFNGYVDAIGNCWGSPSKAKHELLKRTRWLGHCLLDKGRLSEVEQLYLAVNQGQITAEHWFDLCDFAAQEPEHSIFNNLLDELGKNSQEKPNIWLSYLHYIQYRIATKHYNAGNLSRALSWLDTYKTTQSLPPLLELQLLSSQLAAANHRGQENLSLAARTIELANLLQDEAPDQVCHALLRIAISATHSFDFTSLQPVLEKWLSYPIGIPGLANHAKLHSTLGQMLAFQGKTAQSIQHFEQAIKFFNKLSDASQVAREVQQTQTYQAICMMDAQHNEAISYAQSLTTVKSSARPESNRFTHYLLLRLLIHFPELIDERNEYLAQQANWQTGEGHPWMLINAYRGWLLAESGEIEIAKEYFEAAITECSDSDNGAILQWMGQVLAALAIGLGCQIERPSTESLFDAYPQEKLQELISKQLKHEDRVNLLAQLLPFNFH